MGPREQLYIFISGFGTSDGKVDQCLGFESLGCKAFAHMVPPHTRTLNLPEAPDGWDAEFGIWVGSFEKARPPA